jgi:hypothetical protein
LFKDDEFFCCCCDVVAVVPPPAPHFDRLKGLIREAKGVISLATKNTRRAAQVLFPPISVLYPCL